MLPVLDLNDRFLPARQVQERYAISEQTLWRWLRDDRVSFPRPLYIQRFRYFKLSELEAWERARASRRATVEGGAQHASPA